MILLADTRTVALIHMYLSAGALLYAGEAIMSSE